MIREVKFESQDRRMKQVLAALNAAGIKDVEELTPSANNMVSILIRLAKKLSKSASKMQSGLTFVALLSH